MTKNNIADYWTNRYTDELKAIGVDVPSGISYDDLKALHTANRKMMPKKAAPKKAAKRAPRTAAAAPQLDEAAIAAYMDKYMANLAAVAKGEASAGGGGINEEQMLRIIRAAQGSDGATNKAGTLNPNYVDPKDQIPAVRFFSPHRYYFIRSKELAGSQVALPNHRKSIAFQPDFPKTIVNGGKSKRQYTCYVDITSHSLYKWITGKDINGNEVGLPDPLFRVSYFLDPKEMIIDGFAIWERLYYNHRVSLESKPLNVLIGLAQDEAGVIPSSNNDKTVLASRIAKVRADSEFKSAKYANDSMREQSANLASAMFGQAAKPTPLPV